MVECMKFATITEAKTRLSEFVALARKGETIIINHHGKPAVRLLPVREEEFEHEPDLVLTDEEARKLHAWADRERAKGHTMVFESPEAYVAHERARRKKNAAK